MGHTSKLPFRFVTHIKALAPMPGSQSAWAHRTPALIAAAGKIVTDYIPHSAKRVGAFATSQTPREGRLRMRCHSGVRASGQAGPSKFLEQLPETLEKRLGAPPVPRYCARAAMLCGRGSDEAPPARCARPFPWVSMATGRGRLLQQHWRGLLAQHLPRGGLGAARGSAGQGAGPRKEPATTLGAGRAPRARGQSPFRNAGSSAVSLDRTVPNLPRVPPSCRYTRLPRIIENLPCALPGTAAAFPCHFSPLPPPSMPAEILLKILSYLDAVALLCAGCVNRRFYRLASDK
ncbi:F-box only protein 15 [Galemys pyrenaicus]|uniref:F-box only protein 15 n=1 Tax=Galemys pyrenaicus TaxID=202257 RepID=A0A8J5ZMH6_GALPY|nr:F-box only protein 15 [Galemys pyrenaicus]